MIEGGKNKNRYLKFLLPIAVLITLASFLVHEIYSFDVWWQITIGSDILDQLSIPEVDRYTTAAFGRPYHDSHWLFQVCLAIAHRLLGLVGVQFVMIAVWGIALGVSFMACRRWISVELAAFFVFLAGMASIERFLPRPEIVTFLMIAIFWQRLQGQHISGGRNLLVFGLLQAVWANCHGLFVIGPFMVGCYLANALIVKCKNNEIGNLVKLLVVTLLATLVTPFGWKGWQYAFLLATEASPVADETLKSLGELSPVFGAATRSAPAFWFFFALLVFCSILITAGVIKKRLSLARTLILLGLFVAALSGRRNMVLFALVAAPFSAEQIATFTAFRFTGKKLLGLFLAVIILLGAWYPLSGRYFLYMKHPARFGIGSTPSFFPYNLPAFLEKNGFKGQVFNSNYLGGFYLYSHFPGSLPLTDGRWETYDPSDLRRIKEAPNSLESFRQLADRYDIQGALLGHSSPEAMALLPLLKNTMEWKLIYFDYAASFWVRANNPLSVLVNPLSEGLLPGEPKRIEDCWLLNIFLRQIGDLDLQLANLENCLDFGWRVSKWLTEKGQLEVEVKKYSAAEKTYSQLLDLEPADTNAMNELAFLSYVKGDLINAELLLQKALEIDPENKQAVENLKRIRSAQNRRGN